MPELVSEQKKIFTVTEINQKIRQLLESQFASLWLEGEVSLGKSGGS
jgi:exonuclease VII large subunit